VVRFQFFCTAAEEDADEAVAATGMLSCEGHGRETADEEDVCGASTAGAFLSPFVVGFGSKLPPPIAVFDVDALRFRPSSI